MAAEQSPNGNSADASKVVEGTAAQRVTIEYVHFAIGEWLYIAPEDADIIDFVLAVYKSNDLKGDPLWGMIVDASGGGKTELLRALRDRPSSYFLSKLTEKSLVSGYRDPKKPEQDPSLLPEINGKVLIIKDLSPLLSMRRESRNQILGDLRDVYDGFSDHAKGNLGRVGYEARFTFLSATTLAIERYDSVEQELGERCIKFRGRSNETTSKVMRAIQNTADDDQMRAIIGDVINYYLDSLPPLTSTRLSNDETEKLTTLADIIAVARSHVPRDRNHSLRYVPRPEVGTRLGKELVKLYVALGHIRGKVHPDEEDLRTVARVAEDCLPPNRLAVLRVLYATRKPLGVAEIAEQVRLPRNTARNVLEDLTVLELLVQGADKSQWAMNANVRRRLENVALLR